MENLFKIDRNAFKSLFEEYYPNLKAYACLFTDAETAEDIVQEVFVNIWEHRQTIIIHTSIKAYLFRAVYTRSVNHINRQTMLRGKHHAIELALKEYEASFFDPDKNEIIRKLYMNELRQEINNAVASLPPKCREVFELSYIQNLKNKEVSKQLDISVSTVEKHINHALKNLRKLLKSRHALLLFFCMVK